MHDVVDSGDRYLVAVLVVFPPVDAVRSDSGGGSWLNDGFGERWCNRLEVYRDDVVVLLDCDPLGMVEEVPDEADLEGVRRIWNFVC